MSEFLKTKCGKILSGTGLAFTPERIKQHEIDCKKCNPNYKEPNQPGTGKHKKSNKPKKYFEDDDQCLDPFGIIDDDVPDGAFFALCDEIYG